MKNKTDLGQFISEQKNKNSLQSKELAKKLGISMGYLSQIEHGKRLCPDISLIKKMIEIFDLNTDEIYILYDLYEEVTGNISQDIKEYIQSNVIIKKVLRYAKEISASEKDWERIIDFLKNEQ